METNNNNEDCVAGRMLYKFQVRTKFAHLSYYSHLPSHRLAQLHLDSSSNKYVYPKPLRIAQSIVLALDFCKAYLSSNFFLILIAGYLIFLILLLVNLFPPEEEIRNTTPSGLIFLCHGLAKYSQCLTAEALNDF